MSSTRTIWIRSRRSWMEISRMANFKIRAREVVDIEVDVEADSLEEAIELVEGCEVSGVERDSRTVATHFALEGVMGWTSIAAD